MKYITFKINNNEQITLEQLLNNFDCSMKIFENVKTKNNTYTLFTEPKQSEEMWKRICKYKGIIKNFINNNKELIDSDISKEYRTIYIPKRNGGMRRIDKPSERLKTAQTEFRNIIEDFGQLHHTCAYAYIKNRSCYNAAEKHQKNDSKWYLKTDFHNFFGSCNREWVMNQLKKLWPLCELIDENFEKAMNLVFFNGSLPQGSTISPAITNWIMIPIDCAINSKMSKRHIVYTRYSDDIQLSCQNKFNKDSVLNDIKNILKNNDAPFGFDDEKTKFGNRAGKNFMLGVIINKDNNITIGWRAKKILKAAICNIIGTYIDNHKVDPGELQHIMGLISYHESIDKEYTRYLIKNLEDKFKVKLKDICKDTFA